MFSGLMGCEPSGMASDVRPAALRVFFEKWPVTLARNSLLKSLYPASRWKYRRCFAGPVVIAVVGRVHESMTGPLPGATLFNFFSLGMNIAGDSTSASGASIGQFSAILAGPTG